MSLSSHARACTLVVKSYIDFYPRAQDDTFKTKSGRDVALRIFVDAADLPKVDYAMESLKRAMKWDEDVFGAAPSPH